MHSTLRPLSILLSGALLLSSCSIEIPFTTTPNTNTNTTSSTNSTSLNTNNTSSGGLLNAINQNADMLNSSTNSLIASRPASEGCTWEEMKNEDLGIRLLVENCSTDKTKLPYIWKGNKLVNSDGSADQYPSLTVFYKQGQESNEAVLQRLFTSKLGSEEQKNCILNRLDAPTSIAGITRYSIDPNDKVLSDLETKGEPAWGYCGDYGWTNAKTYFEFQKDKMKFVYVNLGQDNSFIDERSIQLLK